MSIEVKNLVKAFDDKKVIDDISFNVDDGKILSKTFNESKSAEY